MNSSRNPDSADSSYTMGYSDEFLQLLDRRNAETNAAHLLAHLEPGMRVLDLGCGPGTISLGLAKAVEPGEMQGIDMEEVTDRDCPGCRCRRRTPQRGLPDGRRDPASL